MTEVSNLRKEMAGLVVKMANLPRKSERDEALWDSIHFIASHLGVEVEKKSG